jgi:ketosteroid isomerase-like protein
VGGWHTGPTLGGDIDADDGEDGRLREALGRRVRVKDLDRVLAFYTNDVIFHSPLIARLSHDPSGTVQGKAALRAYVKKGFEVFDHIKFTVLEVLRGVDSIAIHYRGITGTHVVEVLFFDKDGMVRESYVHYASPD